MHGWIEMILSKGLLISSCDGSFASGLNLQPTLVFFVPFFPPPPTLSDMAAMESYIWLPLGISRPLPVCDQLDYDDQES